MSYESGFVLLPEQPDFGGKSLYRVNCELGSQAFLASIFLTPQKDDKTFGKIRIMSDCVFCKIIAKGNQKDTIFEDGKVLVMLDVDWAVKGHTLVIWKEHFENASEMSVQDFKYFSEIYHKTERALLNVLRVDKAVVLKSGGLVSHFHFHIYPVKKETGWQTIKDAFDKKIRYYPKAGEKEKLVSDLKEKF